MSDFLIRPVVPEDYAQWLPLWLAYNAFYGRSGATALPDLVTETAWARFLDPVEPMSALVAIKDGMIAGLDASIQARTTWPAVAPVSAATASRATRRLALSSVRKCGSSFSGL